MSLQREQAAIRAMEEQQMKEEKRKAQAKRKADLDYSLKLKLKKQVSLLTSIVLESL